MGNFWCFINFDYYHIPRLLDSYGADRIPDDRTMTQVTEKNGAIEVRGQEFDMKLDQNRKIYVKSNLFKDQYHFIGERLPPGLTKSEKKHYMYVLHTKVEQSYQDKKEAEKGYLEGEVKDEENKNEDDDE